MAEYTYAGPSVQVVPELTAQAGEGTLILRPGQRYAFGGSPPGDPSCWQRVLPAPPALPVPAVQAPAPVTAEEG